MGKVTSGTSWSSRDRHYLVIGHWALDKQEDGTYLPGGTVLYAGSMASRLGWKVRVVSSGRSSQVLEEYLPGAEAVVKPSAVDTVFENRYVSGARVQRLLAKASELALADIPEIWLSSDIVHIAPIADEVSEELAVSADVAWLGVTPQGWMRSFDRQGHVSARSLERPERWLPRAAVVMSIDDVGGDWGLAQYYGALAKVLVVTVGAAGATLFYNGAQRSVPPVPAREVDPTGAGDVFAAAFFCKLAEGFSPEQAALFASCAAALAVAGRGVEKVPRADAVLQLFDRVMDGYRSG